jgi:membrane protein
VNLVTWPLWRDKLHAEYGPFYYSVTIVLWSFLGAMIILGGAEWAARRARATAAAAN